VPTLREPVAAGNTSDVNVDQQLLFESAGVDCLSDVPVPDVPLHLLPLPDVPLPEAWMDGTVWEQCTRPHVAEEAIVVVFGLGSSSCLARFVCSNLFISLIDYYMCRNVFGSLKV